MLRFFRLIPLVTMLAVAVGLCPARDRRAEQYEAQWREFRIPPFEVVTERDGRDVRAFLGDLFQYQHLLRTLFPGKEVKAHWPIRIWVLRASIPDAKPDFSHLPLVDDRYIAILNSPPSLTPTLKYQLARTILEDSLRPMTKWFEQGLLSLLGGANINGQITDLGVPVSPDARNLDWARVYALLAAKESIPALSALVGNLEKGMDFRLALRNSYQIEPENLDALAKTTLASSNVKPVAFSGLANNPRTDFRDWRVPLGYGELARVSTLAAARDTGALGRMIDSLRPGYDRLDPLARVEVQNIEALNLLDSRSRERAARLLGELTATGVSTSARVYLEAAKLATSPAEKVRLAKRAKELNPDWAAPDLVLASVAKSPAARAQLLSEGARLDARNRSLWDEAVEAALAARDYALADANLESAERATGSDADLESLRERRRNLSNLRVEKEEDDRQAKLAAERKEIDALRSKTMARIDAALARANKQNESPGLEKLEIVKYGEQDQPQTVTGKLTQVECHSGGRLVLVFESDSGHTRLLLPDRSRLSVEGGGTLDLRCGAQRPARSFTARYMPKPHTAYQTVGELESIQGAAEQGGTEQGASATAPRKP
ncbi:MAG: hypothetical protein LC114_16725 [Bryobacterales bacterium]|nr:hypothetical protein [Bryobacterales bacterium]